jgi:hypothetical protein
MGDDLNGPMACGDYRSMGKRFEPLGTVEAADQREAYRLAIEKFDVPIERQGRLFVVKLDDKATINE